MREEKSVGSDPNPADIPDAEVNAAANEIRVLTGHVPAQLVVRAALAAAYAVRNDAIEQLRNENELMRGALQCLIDEADSDNVLTAWDAAAIARAALGRGRS
jgi:hypothetical protein